VGAATASAAAADQPSHRICHRTCQFLCGNTDALDTSFFLAIQRDRTLEQQYNKPFFVWLSTLSRFMLANNKLTAAQYDIFHVLDLLAREKSVLTKLITLLKRASNPLTSTPPPYEHSFWLRLHRKVKTTSPLLADNHWHKLVHYIQE
jgi:hypothetical protein